jgi:hypothetical protein
VIVGAFQAQGTKHTEEVLSPASGKARFLSAATPNSRALLIAGVGIETLLDRSCRQLQDALSHDELQRFQIQLFHRLTTEERLNLLNDVDGQ